MAKRTLSCFTLHRKKFRGARLTNPLRVSVHATGIAMAKKLYEEKGFNSKGVIFRKNDSCETAHTNHCQCERLVAYADQAIPYIPQPPELPSGYFESLGVRPEVAETEGERRQRKMLEAMRLV